MSAALQPADDVLRRVVDAPHLLVALDFDGTLSPLVDDPMTARMLPEARTAVEALLSAPGTTVALVSGRSLHDLREIAEHGDDSRILLAGSHGAEYWLPGQGVLAVEDDPSDVEKRDLLRAHAEQATADLEGIWIEPKSFGFGVHARRATDADGERAFERVDALVAAEAPHWRRRSGHHIVEYAFRHEGKDTGVARLRSMTHADAVLFAGDDVTDEDALKSLAPGDLGVRVGAGETAAAVSVADIPAFAALLSTLAAERSAARE
ncbi:trehalose-phosphatase [Microbacterium hominis]|uniref:Trehalose 6-phosphate phosphatase n=1 Tax=Microbacterium hominis TaxID=162426 RepID=A0A7D4QI58_9MICO|nr:trehalose-phosphatase [Microbacterium hominis]QKJ19216.1 trehalose-phosphatase [Microbacterium hominis]